jgi:cytochrome c oxidase accessory protein FixG
VTDTQRAPEEATFIEGPLYVSAKKIYPQRVHGFYRQLKWAILAFCLVVYYFLPFVRWDRGPNLPNQAVLADLQNRRFYFFFIEIWPQEVYYFTGLLIIAAMVLFLMNSIAGRVWCGYLCWQTVWTDLFMAVERHFQGDRRERIKLDAEPWHTQKIIKKGMTHLVWLLIAWWTGGAWVLYFADAPTLVNDLIHFRAPFTAYMWIAILTFTTYVFAGIMREQTCLYVCPWPRIQAALTDEDALNVTYKYDRGEPRMSLKDARKATAVGQPAGDCVDCQQCVNVCPTGVDIRHGSQLGCIQCGLCIDACDTVMEKIGRPKRLIGYDTDIAVRARMNGDEHPTYRFFRARTYIYFAMISVVGGLMVYQLATRSTTGVSAIHDRQPLFTTLADGAIRNAYTIRVLNKRPETRDFEISVEGLPNATVEIVGIQDAAASRPIVEVGPDQTREVRMIVSAPRSSLTGNSTPITVRAADLLIGEAAVTKDHFFGPGK